MTTQSARCLLLFAFAAIVATSTPAPAAAVTQVFYCGQILRGRGVLIGNLDCTGFGGSGVTIERGKLELAGFTINGAAQFGVHCMTTCLIQGPGTITGNGLDGVHTEGSVTVRTVMISNNALDGVNARNFSSAGRVRASDSTITGNGFNGVEADTASILRRTTITANHEHGVDVGVQNCDTTGRVLLFRSSVTGNATACTYSPVCADLTSCGRNDREPRLRSSSLCHKSYVRGSGSPGQTWGVCSQD